MRNAIFAKLVTKYPALSKTYLGLLATQLAKTVTEESQIDAALTGLDTLPISITELAAEFQKEGDKRATDARKELLKTHIPKPAPKTEGEEAEEEDEAEDPPATKPAATDPVKKKKERTPEWAKNLMAEVQSLKTEKAQTTIKGKITEQLKDVPVKFYGKWKFPEKEEDIEAFVEEVKNDYAEFQPAETQTQEVKAGFTPAPKTGSGSANGSVKPSDKELDEIMKKIV